MVWLTFADCLTQLCIGPSGLVAGAAATATAIAAAGGARTALQAKILHKPIGDIAVRLAVALDDGLITPIVKMADRKGLAAIANETKDLVARARAGKLKLEEFQGGTFSISNLGMYGVREFAAIINPPHATILAIGAVERRPIEGTDGFRFVSRMTVTLSCDHRIVDGALGGELLSAFKSLVEHPVGLLV